MVSAREAGSEDAVTGVDAVADDHQRIDGVGEDFGGVFDGGGFRAWFAVDLARWLKVNFGEVVHGIAGQCDEDRAGRRSSGFLESPSHDGWDLFGMGDLGAPFCEWSRHVCQIAAVVGKMADVLVACGDDDGRSSTLLVDHQAEAVGEAVVDVKADKSDLAACAGIPLGHTDGDAFLDDHQVFEVGVFVEDSDEGGFAGAGIAEDVADALGTERLHECVFALEFGGHRCVS